MKIQKVLTVIVGVLLFTLAAQIGVRYYSNDNGVQLFAEWKDIPKSPEEATRLADEVVLGQVTDVRRAEDLVLKIEGEPNAEDRIPVQIATFKVEKNYKGKSSTIELFYIGGQESPASKEAPPDSEAPKRPKDGNDKSKAPPRPSEEDLRQYSVHDNPIPKKGDRELLFLRKGPNAKVGGKTIETKAIISPTTRFKVGANNVIQPITDKGFAPTFRSKKLSDLETKIKSTVVSP